MIMKKKVVPRGSINMTKQNLRRKLNGVMENFILLK